MRFFQPAKIDGVEHISIEDQPLCRHFAAVDGFEKMAQLFRLAIVTAEVDVREDDRVVHEASLSNGRRARVKAVRRLHSITTNRRRESVHDNISLFPNCERCVNGR